MGQLVAQNLQKNQEFLHGKDKIIVNEKMETNMKGIYACGDCTGGLLQISKAVYEGTKAGMEVIQYVRSGDLRDVP